MLTLALVLSGCKTSTSDSGSSDSSTPPTDSSETGGSSSSSSSGGTSDTYLAEAEEMLLDLEYEKVSAWPTTPIAAFLNDLDITGSVPSLSSKTPLFYDAYYDTFYEEYVFEVAILDTTAASLTSALSTLKGAGWLNEQDFIDSEFYFDIESPNGEFYVWGEVYEGDETFPEATYLYVTVPDSESDGGDGGEGGEGILVTGWPTEIIAEYLEEYGVDVVIPSLPFTGEVVVEYFNDDFYELGFEYIGFFIEGENVLDAFNALLTAAGFNIEEDTEYEDSYYAYDSTWEKVMIEYFYGEDETSEGTVFYITVLVDENGGGNGGEVTPPTNPEDSAVFSFLNKAQILGAENANLTTWKSGDSTFAVAKTGANENVGNGSYFSNPLRIYGKQTVTITAGGGKLIEQITFTISVTNDAGRDSIDTLIELLSGRASYSSTASSVTFAFNTPAASVSFQTPRQFRLDGLTLYFVSAE